MEEQWREALRLYVAMTRGRDQVLFTYRDKPSEFLLSMKEFITWNDAADDKARKWFLWPRAESRVNQD